MEQPFILTRIEDGVGIVTLNRPQVLNAWHRPMRDRLFETLDAMENDPGVLAIVVTGAGDRAFSAGQDLNESKSFDSDRAEDWIDEWDRLYHRIRTLSKPIVMALNGLAAGSAFQVALLGDLRVGHPGITMGQPEVNSGIASVTGPWIMYEMLGIARTTDLALTGRMMPAEEAHAIGLLSRLVPREQVLDAAVALARELGSKPPIAMRLTKSWLREMTEPAFRGCIAAAIRIHREAYGSGEPGRMAEHFLDIRGKRTDGR